MSFLTCFWLLPQNEHFSRSPPSPMRAIVMSYFPFAVGVAASSASPLSLWSVSTLPFCPVGLDRSRRIASLVFVWFWFRSAIPNIAGQLPSGTATRTVRGVSPRQTWPN